MRALPTLALVAALGLGLGACTSVMKNNVVTGKVAGGGVSIAGAPTPGLQAGYIQSAVTSTPALDGKGVVITHHVQCNVESGLNVYAIQNGNASAASSVNNGPASSVAINEGTMTGDAARLAALGGGQAPSAEAIAALNDCSKAAPAKPATP